MTDNKENKKQIDDFAKFLHKGKSDKKKTKKGGGDGK